MNGWNRLARWLCGLGLLASLALSTGCGIVLTCSPACSLGETCVSGVCQCQAGSKLCQSTTDLYACTGGQFVFEVRCNPGFECTTGVCACTTNVTTCVGNDSYICTAGQFVLNQRCSASQTCSNGACVGSQCTPGSTGCSGNDLYNCNAGTWVRVQTCANQCYQGACTSSCPGGTTACTDSRNCATDYVCLDRTGYACTATSTGCACAYGVCGVTRNTCVNSLDCCANVNGTYYECNASTGRCVSAGSGRNSGKFCRRNGDCFSGSCVAASSGCYGTCT